MNFSQLHHQENPLLLANVWDVPSATIAEAQGFDAIGTSSASMAALLGYEDGEQMPFEALLFMVERIAQSTSLPLSVDIESGYSRDTSQVLANIEQLVALGVVGINIEDSVVNAERELVDAESFAELITHIKKRFGDALFINARTDTYLLGVNQALQATLDRIVLFEQAGADGIFIPCLTDSHAIKTICNATPLPVNLMSMPDLADFAILQALGVKRLSSGNFAFDKMYQGFSTMLTTIKSDQNFNPLFQ